MFADLYAAGLRKTQFHACYGILFKTTIHVHIHITHATFNNKRWSLIAEIYLLIPVTPLGSTNISQYKEERLQSQMDIRRFELPRLKGFSISFFWISQLAEQNHCENIKACKYRKCFCAFLFRNFSSRFSNTNILIPPQHSKFPEQSFEVVIVFVTCFRC